MVGIGPGGVQHRTRRAEEVIGLVGTVSGYTPYLESIEDLTVGKKLISSGMRREAERVRAALEATADGTDVALVSSGDAGIYGMAGLAIEMNHKEHYGIEIEVIPGVTAAGAAAAAIGAPLMLDYATVSLSDLLVPWDKILVRLEGAAMGGFVTALYNPRSKKRVTQLQEAIDIFKKYRPGHTPCAVVTAAGTDEEVAVITDLDHLFDQEIGMRSLVIIANETAEVLDGVLVTPRGYQL